MKLIIVAALALVAVVVAAPPQAQDPKAVPQILKSEFAQQPDGAYNFALETEDGISRQEEGSLKTLPDEDNKPREVVVVKGSFAYTDPEGNPQTISYYADETGYHAEGPSIPVAPSARR